MARIPYVEIANLPPEMQAMVANRPLNIFKMLPHAKTAAPGFLALGNALLTQGELDAGLRELVIVRVGLLSHATYEVHQHKQLARRVGVAEAKITALDEGPEAAAFDAKEAAVLRFTDTVVREVKAPEALFAAVATHLTHRELCELLLTIGFYMMVSRFLENLEVDIEDTNLFEREAR